nr:YhgE/Pip domain-containing protein [Enterococcus italicus]
MIKKEFKKIWQNKLLFVTVIVVSLIPILYASVFLKSIWDPYGNMSELPVAVVNLDESVDFQDKTLNVGSELVDNLKKNSDLDWNFVSQSAAKKGLKNRKYYMIVTIPKDFSKNAATVLDSDPEKMNLKYETNAGVNYLGEVVSDNAMKQLKAQVSEKVTKSYATAIIATIKELGSGMTTAAEGSEKLHDGATQVDIGVGTLAESVPTLASGVSQLASGSNTLQSGVSQYTAGVAQVADGSNQLNTGIGQLTSQLPTLTNGLSALGTGANSLSSGLTTYTNGVAQVASGSTKLQNKLNNELIPAINQLTSGANELSNKLNQVSLANPENGTSSEENRDQLINYVKGVQTYLSKVETDLSAIDLSQLPDMSQLENSFGAVTNNLNTIKTSLENVHARLDSAIESDVNSNTAAVTETLADSGVTLTAEQQSAIALALKNNESNSQVLSLVQTILSNMETSLLTVQQTLSEVKNSLPNYNLTTINNLSNKLNELQASTSTLKQYSKVTTPALENVVNGIYKIETEASPGASKIASGLSEIQNQVPILTAGVSQIATGASTLNNNSSQLTSGASQLASGLQTVNDKTPNLTSGVSQLADGIATLADGANTLNSKSAELNSGTAQLAEGLDTLNGKIPSLSSGVLQLKDGTSQLAAGTNELATKLKDGSAKINDLSLGDKNAEMIANPDKETQTKYSSVPNYGHALAPYFMSVSLFVGSLVFNFVYPIRKIADRKGASAAQWFRSKVTIGGLVATTMALVIGTVMQMIGLTVSNQWQFYGILLATAWVNMFLIMFLAMSFDNPGRFIAVLLLVVQLGSAGGVFPMEITSRFYNIVHPYIPMTYSIYGLRQSISTGLGNELYNQSLLILVVLIIALLALLRLSMQILFKRGLAGYSQLHNTQKLLDDDYMNKREKYTLW